MLTKNDGYRFIVHDKFSVFFKLLHDKFSNSMKQSLENMQRGAVKYCLKKFPKIGN